MEWLVDLLDLGLHHQFHVEGDLAAAASDEAKKTPDFRNAIAHGVPSDVGLSKAKFLHQGSLDFETAIAERRQCPGSAAELADQNAGTQLIQTLEVALEPGQIGRNLVAERDRYCLLEIAAARHRRVAMPFGQCRKRIRDRHEIGLNEIQRFADLQDRGGVRDVLGGGTPMTPLAEAVPAQGNELLHDRQHRIADAFGLSFELAEIVLGDRTMTKNLLTRILRNDAQARLGAG